MAEFKPVDLQKYLTESEAAEKKSFGPYPPKPVDKTDKTPKGDEAEGFVSYVKSIPGVSAVEKNVTDTLPRLPWQLERLVRAASSDLLPEGSTMLESGLVTDLNRHTLAWAASYLTGDRDEVLSRLWQARRVWQGEPLS